MPGILGRLPSCKIHQVSCDEDLLSVSQHLINRSVHTSSAAGNAVSSMHGAIDPESPVGCHEISISFPGVSLATTSTAPGVVASGAAQGSTSSNSSGMQGTTSLQSTLGAFAAPVSASGVVSSPAARHAMSGAASPEASFATSSDEGGRTTDPSPQLRGARHVFNIPPIAEGHIIDEFCGVLQSSKATHSEHATGGGQQGDGACGGFQKSGVNDCEEGGAMVPRPRRTDDAAAEAVAAAAASVAHAYQTAKRTERAQQYMAELLQLREVVEALGQHLDGMINSTESSVSGSSVMSSGNSRGSDEGTPNTNADGRVSTTSAAPAPTGVCAPTAAPAGASSDAVAASTNDPRAHEYKR